MTNLDIPYWKPCSIYYRVYERMIQVELAFKYYWVLQHLLLVLGFCGTAKAKVIDMGFP